MRIIDSNIDFYDFYQNVYRDDHIVFDRRDSYDLSKEEFMKMFEYRQSWRFNSDRAEEIDRTRYILLQICNTFWLFKMYIKKYIENYRHDIEDYTLTLIHSWKDYSLNREKLKLSEISLTSFFDDKHGYRFFELPRTVEEIEQRIHINEYKTMQTFDKFLKRDIRKGQFIDEECCVPILKNIGVASCVDPLAIYLALEEYFSAEITASERTESIGLTDREKVENHGFDTKTSFRGKV